MATDIRELVRRLIRLEQTNRNRIALAAGMKAQNLSSWLNEIIHNYISFKSQQKLLLALGIRMSHDYSNRINLDLVRGRLMSWIVTLRPKGQPEVATLADVRYVLAACKVELKWMQGFRYQGSPSFSTVLTLPGETVQASAWIYLSLDDSAVEGETLDAETLGVDQMVDLPAGQWFEGLNGARINLDRMEEAFRRG